MVKEIFTFVDIEIKRHRFYCHKSPVFSEDVDIEKGLVSNEISSVE